MGEKEDKRFADCVDRCGQLLKDCMTPHKGLWPEFTKNQRKLTRLLEDCCNEGEYDPEALPDTSYATCVKQRCNAQLYGCQLKKRHTGFLSPEERATIEERKRRQKARENTLRSGKSNG